MKQVINRTLYDTENAEQVAQYAPNTDQGDFNYLVETLYKTSDGEYFLHGDGGSTTKWSEYNGSMNIPSEEIKLFTPEEAVDWCEKRAIDGEIVLDEFEDYIEIAE